MQIAQHPLAEKWKQKLNELETEWRNFLLNSPDFVKGDNSHHILLCDENLLAAGVRNSPNLMLSVMRSSAFYLFEKFGKAYVFSNLAGTQVISMVFPAELPVSQGTQVYPEQTFGITPQGIGWGGYFQNLLALAALSDGATSRLSSTQRARIDRAMNTDRAVKSEDVRILVKQLLALKYLP